MAEVRTISISRDIEEILFHICSVQNCFTMMYTEKLELLIPYWPHSSYILENKIMSNAYFSGYIISIFLK